MFRAMLLAVVLCGPIDPVYSQAPEPSVSVAKVVIEAPEKAKVGELVVLNASGSTAANFKWCTKPETKNFLVIDGGKRAVFTAESGGEFLFMVAAAKNDSVDMIVHKIVVGTIAPNPNATLEQKIHAWCNQCTSPTKRDDVLRLAQSFNSVLAIIDAGIASTPAEIVQATAKSNRDALDGNITYWMPLLQGIQAELKAASDAGRLTDTASHIAMWKQISNGLKSYAETLD